MLAVLAESALRSCLLGSVVWVGLNLLRVRNPHVHMMSWVLVLVASLAMPLLMHWTTVTVTLTSPPLALPDPSVFAGTALPELSSLPPLTDFATTPVTAPADVHHAINWGAIGTAIYALVAGFLLLRLAVGLSLTWRLARRAQPVDQPWAAAAKVRVSDAIGAPVTFGSTILLPPHYVHWDGFKRDAVLAHEGAHIANRDFYLLLLANFNRAVFWFNPLAWWQVVRMAELAEIISDATALEALDDRVGYAELLLDLVQNVRPIPAALEMARASTIRARVEHILATTSAPTEAGWRRRAWTAAAVLPLVVVSAGSIGFHRVPAPSSDEAMQPAPGPQHVDFYAISPAAIFAVSREGDRLFGQLTGQRKLPLTVSGERSYAYPAAAGEISFSAGEEQLPAELTLHQSGRDLRVKRISTIAPGDVAPDAGVLDAYAGWYLLGQSRVLSVTRDGSRLLAQETGRAKLTLTAVAPNAFASARGDLLLFLREGEAPVTRILVQDPISGARSAQRTDAAKAKLVEAEFARRIAEIPDRFRDQVPAPGSKEAVLRGIDSLQHGVPAFDLASAPLAARLRSQTAQLVPIFQSLGAVESIFFRGVGPGGYDIYGVKFANGTAEFRLLLAADGKIDDVAFRPDGDDAPGGIAACSAEPGLRSRDAAAPIKILIYNGSGHDVLLHGVDAAGRRVARGSIGDNMSTWVMTSVDSPMVVTDAAGRCLEIVLPGLRTRRHIIDAQVSERPAPLRSSPLAGSEDILRQHIDAIRRGEPDYDRMTGELATQIRAQLPFEQAIVARLGALRSLSFRGVSPVGSDVYMAHFANGSTEWRIGMAREGTIARIALGPSY